MMGILNDNNVINFNKKQSISQNSTQYDSHMLQSKKDGMDNIEYLNTFMSTYIENFLQELKMNSIHTYRNYLCDINALAKGLLGYKDYKEITRNDLESLTIDKLLEYRSEMYNKVDEFEEREFTNGTINRRFACYKKLFEYLEARDKIKYPISKMKSRIKNLPKDSVEIAVLSTEDTERCIEFFKNHPHGYVVYLISKFSVDTGLRARELTTLTWKQFTVDGNDVIVKSRGKIKGKGNKDWKKTISLNFYNEVLTLKEEGSDKVFDVSYEKIAKLMKTATTELELTDKDYKFHSFRKRAATNVYNETGDILAVKEFLNHSSVSTTQKYVKARDYNIKGVYSRGDEIDKELYKKVDRELLLDTLGELDKGIINLLNIKINEKL